MQKKIVLLLVLVLVAGLSLSAKEAVVGENLKMKKTTMVSEILEKPDGYTHSHGTGDEANKMA